jgi:carboxyl-terminal processing protease
MYRLWNELQPDPLGFFGVFWEAWDAVEQYFYGALPSPTERTYGAIHTALLLLNDPYTVFIEPQPRELERDRMRGTFGGVGVTLWRNAEGQIVLSPYADSPAERAGICEGDILLSVDRGTITDETSIDDVRAWLHGEINTPVTLTISRLTPGRSAPTLPLTITIIRDEILLPSVTWRVLDQSPGIGYVRIESFTERTGDEIASALQELREREISSLILDLRDNAGGLIDPSVATASQFLQEGIVFIERRRDDQERTFSVQNGGIATDIPLAILVNGGTASASEIVAGALQDHNRGPLIGEPTFGKGSVQLIYDLSDGSSLHVTTAVWLTPNQRRLEGQGLTPDIYVPRGTGLQDEQLDRAVDYLQNQQ